MSMNDAVRDYLLQQIGDEELIQEIYAEFLTGFRAGLASFKEAMESCNMEKMRHWAHTLKGNAGIVGEKDLKNLAVQLEDCVKREDQEGYASFFAQLEQEFATR